MNDDGSAKCTFDHAEQHEPEEYGLFFQSIGECLSSWGKVEIMLSGLFGIAMRTNDSKAVMSVFESATGFRAKLEMTDAALKNSSLKIDETWWDGIANKLRKGSKNRNQVAHLQEYHLRSEPENRRFFLSSAKSSLKSRVHYAALKQYSESFLSLCDELMGFHKKIHGDNKSR